jgi:hypothetical protein
MVEDRRQEERSPCRSGGKCKRELAKMCEQRLLVASAWLHFSAQPCVPAEGGV